MNETSRTTGSTPLVHFKSTGISLTLQITLWTVLILILAAIDTYQSYTAQYNNAVVMARINYSKDAIFRLWASGHGGVYVPVTPSTQPNPYLSHIPDRDVVLPSGKLLTLMNPAYMTRQMHELGAARENTHGHLTSLNPIRPQNAPDEWEQNALRLFETDRLKEHVSFSMIDGEPYLRLMRPFQVEKTCLKCHEKQGYNEGDIRGGLSISVPWAPQRRQWLAGMPVAFGGYGCLWLAGALSLRFFNRRSQLELLENEKLAIDLEQAMYDAQAASQSKSNFLAVMSHEIRTPMNGVIGMTELLMTTPMTEDQLKYAGTIRSCGKKLMVIINDILDFSKIEAGKLVLELCDFDVREMVRDIFNLLHAKASDAGLKLSCHIDQSVPQLVTGDVSRLGQIVINLVGNAIKFTSQGDVIIRVKLDSQHERTCIIRIEVQDTGIGIPHNRLISIFEHFTQADSSTTRKFGGTGLGLAICKKLAELMGGEIGVVSVEGKGSTFWFTARLVVPAHCPAAAPSDGDMLIDALSQQPGDNQRTSQIPDGCSATSKTSPAPFKGRILLAEDDPTSQQMAQFILEKLNYQVDVVDNGHQAVKALEEFDYDLVLMDCMMPLLDGFEASTAIRAPDSLVINRNVPIIALTANALSDDRDKCIDAGMNDYLTKPINVEEFIITLETWIKFSAQRKNSDTAL
ncbi:MAG TPA: DUF3365 domain-containing protein [Desulfuromonadales bacterium]|nr:DUF3365 domain-containing protein [Desulfuromonadales bacterium]